MNKPPSSVPKKPISAEMDHFDPLIFSRNMAQVVLRMQQVTHQYLDQKSTGVMDAPFDPLNVAEAFSQFYAALLNDPQKLMQTQQQWWENYMTLCNYAARKMLGDESAKPPIEPLKDKRFANENWQDHAVFDVIRQAYLLAAQQTQALVSQSKGLDAKTAQKVEFYTKQWMDALSPSNFLLTNPEVLQATLASNAKNLLAGMDHMERDLKSGNIRMTDTTAFKVGENLATTPGYVVFKNELMELIQYSPTTKNVYEVPVLMIPAWINKFYILDLQEKNSYTKWLIDQGYTVFVISWVNPDKTLARKNFEDYMKEGPLAAMEVIKSRCGSEQLHTVGYCLGGTLLATTLAWLHAKNKAQRVVSATYLTTMIDFADAGDLSVFVDESQLSQMEERMQEKGYLEGRDMAATFNMLRSNDLIWSFFINNYLLGKEPFPFDLLYWNSDATRMPAAMHSFYMRNMYLENKLVKKGGITLDKTPIDVRAISTPTFILSTREDHIAPWKSTYASTGLYQGPVEFVLAASGHIAGVMNSPAKNKYCYWTAGKLHPKDPDKWLETAKQHTGSWWPHWQEWLAKKSGKKIAARAFSAAEKKKLVPAPGTYVGVMSALSSGGE